MIVADIAAILKTTSHLILLSSTASKATIADALVALANNGGGSILVGVNKRGKAQKINNPSAVQDKIMQIALQCDPPLIIPLPKIQNHQEHPILFISVPPDLPGVYNFEGRYLTWENGKIVPLRGNDLRRLIFARGETGFDSLIASETSRDDINWDAVQSYVSTTDTLQHLSAEEALLKRGCLKRDGNMLKPTHAGLLLFGRDPQRWLPQAEIVAVRYTGTQMTDTFLRADIRGTLPEQARRAEAFVRENIGQAVKINKLQRTDAYLYPISAVREIVVNALSHRDYSIQGDNIRLILFSDRLECYSPGRLPGHITVENMQQERFSRNAVIVQVLYDMGFIERLGYGIDRVVRSLAEQGNPQPTFEETSAGFKITFLNSNFGYGQENNVREWLKMGFNDRQIKAMGFVLDNGRITNADYQALCPTVSAETLRRDLADLVSRDALLRIGEKRATFYIAK